MPAARAEWHLAYVRADGVDQNWDWIEPFLTRAIEKAPTNLTTEDIRVWAKEEKARIWVVSQSWRPVSALFVVRQSPDGTVEFLTLSGSRIGEWLPVLFPEFCRLARRNGIKRLWMAGRRGWQRWLAPVGFVFRGMNDDRVLMEKVLDA